MCLLTVRSTRQFSFSSSPSIMTLLVVVVGCVFCSDILCAIANPCSKGSNPAYLRKHCQYRRGQRKRGGKAYALKPSARLLWGRGQTAGCAPGQQSVTPLFLLELDIQGVLEMLVNLHDRRLITTPITIVGCYEALSAPAQDVVEWIVPATRVYT